MLKTLNKCEWKDIEVGEVFAYEGCWVIMEKLDDKHTLALECDSLHLFSNNPIGRKLKIEEEWGRGYSFGYLGNSDWGSGYLYKLSLSVQRLWRCDK